MSGTTYIGVAPTLEVAFKNAHSKIRPSPGKDFTSSKVSSWGMQFGGFMQEERFWVEVVEDPTAPFRPDE